MAQSYCLIYQASQPYDSGRPHIFQNSLGMTIPATLLPFILLIAVATPLYVTHVAGPYVGGHGVWRMVELHRRDLFKILVPLLKDLGIVPCSWPNLFLTCRK